LFWNYLTFFLSQAITAIILKMIDGSFTKIFKIYKAHARIHGKDIGGRSPHSG